MNRSLLRTTAVRMSLACRPAALFFVVLLALGGLVTAAPPSEELAAKIVGKWNVTGPGFDRIYEITAGHNVRITGGESNIKGGRLEPQNDGSYILKVNYSALEKITYNAASDRLHVEYFGSKIKLGLGEAMWKSDASRMP